MALRSLYTLEPPTGSESVREIEFRAGIFLTDFGTGGDQDYQDQPESPEMPDRNSSPGSGARALSGGLGQILSRIKPQDS
jgi:hypothetical protein